MRLRLARVASLSGLCGFTRLLIDAAGLLLNAHTGSFHVGAKGSFVDVLLPTRRWYLKRGSFALFLECTSLNGRPAVACLIRYKASASIATLF